MPANKLTPAEVELILGGALVSFGQKRPLPSKQSSEVKADPMQPAVDAIEKWGRKTFGGRAKADGQEEHDRWLQSQPDSQVKTLARNLTDLMRVKDGSSARIRVPHKFPDGCEFVVSFSGDEFVAFPDGKVFKASDDGEMLIPTGGLPVRNAAPMSEAGFVSACAKSHEFFARKRQQR